MVYFYSEAYLGKLAKTGIGLTNAIAIAHSKAIHPSSLALMTCSSDGIVNVFQSDNIETIIHVAYGCKLEKNISSVNKNKPAL